MPKWFTTFADMNSNEIVKGVAVYCASSSEIDAKYMDVARLMGTLLAEAGLPLVCGGGAGGMMAAAIEGCRASGGTAVGVLPRFMVERDWNHPRLSHMIVTETMHQRKQTMASMARGAVALPGGIGTLDELAEIMTWHQLGIFPHPVVIVNTDGYYDSLLRLFREMDGRGFMRGGAFPASVAATPGEALNLILKR